MNKMPGGISVNSKHWEKLAKDAKNCPGWVDQWVRMLPGYTKVAGLFPIQGTWKKQPMNA